MKPLRQILLPTVPTPWAALHVALVLSALCNPSWVSAQMKVGNNPRNLAPDTNLQVEATNGSSVVVRKSTAQVGVGTTSPANRLEVNSGSSAVSGVRLSQLPNASYLGTNASGDIVAKSTTQPCWCGDIKTSLQTSNHGDWKLMNGSSHTGSCGTYAFNASGSLMVQGPGVGTFPGATGVNITRGQLPLFVLTGTPSSHTHSHGYSQPINAEVGPGNYGLARQTSNGENRTQSGVDTSGSGTEPDVTQAPWKIPADTHSHTLTTENFNNTGSQTGVAVTMANLPRLHTNYFICIN